MSNKPTGRPAGSKNIDATADAHPSQCPACGSTNRGPYLGTANVQEYGGTHEGRPHTHIIRKRTTCADCGQTRIDRTFENRPAEKKK